MTWVTLALLAALFKSLATISEKEVLIKSDASNYMSGISLVIALASLPLLYFVKDMSLTLDIVWIILFFSILAAINGLSISYVIQKLDISESGVLLATTPIIVSIMGMVFIGEFLTPMQVLGIFVSAIGLFILEFKKKEVLLQSVDTPPSRKKLYIILGVSLIFFGATTVGDRYVIHYLKVDPVLYLVLVQLGISLSMFFYDLAKNGLKVKGVRSKFLDPKLLTQKLFWTNVVFIICHRLIHMFAVSLVAAGLLNAVKQINAVITTILGGMLFKEKGLIRRAIACLVIVAGVVLVIV